ncbi:hypothetical protein IFM89_012546 [Coptis chinensis]|uniref:START domain-containing protein n=1 Tax=Coptis chinensis TaxID=261450 RepID=A0A835HM55_9MAGN|nr:hypothetical protein IFM89_012546 [Coptis chinensis]
MWFIMALVSTLVEFYENQTVWGVLEQLVLYVGPLWVALLIGIVIGWVWRPKWVCLSVSKDSSLSFGSISQFSLSSSSIPSLNSLKKMQLPSIVSWVTDDSAEKETLCTSEQTSDTDCSLSQQEKPVVVTREDLEHLCQLVEVKDGGPAWIQMMDRSTTTMAYQAWRRDPETGPPQYRSRTVYEDVTPELMRDFFWDDEFRAKWDDMLIHCTTLEECPTTGAMVVHWIRKFPFFCSDREYIIGRRIWESGRSYYCITKGIPCSTIARRNKPRRVDLYYSSWCIRAVESNRGDGQLTACEVILFHHEDMGIPREIAKLGVRQGMWGAVKKIEPGLRAYQKHRASEASLSRCAFMAQINTKINADYLRSLEGTSGSSEGESSTSNEKQLGRNIPKLLVVGGAVVLACSLDRGLLTKAVIFGVARRYGATTNRKIEKKEVSTVDCCR